MLEVVRELSKQKENYELHKEFRILKSIEAGNYTLSIQGSTSHYCTPRTTELVKYYHTMEIAIFGKRGWLHINRSKVFKGFKRYHEFIEFADCLNCKATVFGYVPVELINDLYLYLKNY
jgi:hypothetical protein